MAERRSATHVPDGERPYEMLFVLAPKERTEPATSRVLTERTRLIALFLDSPAVPGMFAHVDGADNPSAERFEVLQEVNPIEAPVQVFRAPTTAAWRVYVFQPPGTTVTYSVVAIAERDAADEHRRENAEHQEHLEEERRRIRGEEPSP